MIANLCLSNKTVTYSRVLCDVQRTRSTFRAADILPSYKGSRWSYTGNGSWWLGF